MNRPRFGTAAFLIGFSALVVVSCSSQSSQPKQPTASQPAAAQSAPAQQQTAATPPEEPSGNLATTAAPPSGTPATEKHKLGLANYSHVAVTVTLNGTWIGQWDSNTSVPLDQVVVGKNNLTVELPDMPKSEARLEIWTKRDNQDVNLLRLNFQDKPKGTYNYAFAAR